ncbi:Homolog of E. coli HemY protein [Candidatus Nitrotoga sp. HW29]|uniref:heme biosynthesis HemY N-terminal domain-containing protein n=1 Tax=Candidatus Nitrotoga sp. HW29 TaxID=2886963 RepID=UPI001EF208BB|nr:heme biosynthesis HemY N-terminal domain-containing protein [Candidatus Nitrotoga sp. HW29]CAH1904506.1 Homolog of E. coli HemY protein [Candidatus Nitrotoga sp. HW29]
MKFLMWILGLFSLAVALKLAAHNPGYVLFVYPPYRIEVSLTLFLLIMLALLVLGYLTVRLALSVIRLPAYVRQFRIERAHRKGRSAMMEALDAFFEGRFAVAEKAAVRAMELGENSGLNPVIAARAAHELREFERRDAYLATADNESTGVSTMRLMAQAKFNLDQHQPQAALQSLKELRESGVKGHVGALHLELRAQQQARNWDAILDVVEQLEKRSAMDSAAVAQIRQQAWLEKIRAHMLDAPALLAIWKSTPGEFKKRPKVVAAAARALIHHGDCRNARQIITDRLNAAWDSDLVILYGECLTGEAGSYIEQAERWLKQHPDDAGLLLVLGKLCLHQGLWSKAQNYLDASNSIAPSSVAYTTLGHLSEKLQQPDEAFKYFQKAMALTHGK